MQTKRPETPAPQDKTSDNGDLNDAIRNYVRAYALWHGRPQAAQRFGVSRHTLWRFLERGHLGRSLPRAVTGAVGEDPEDVDSATQELVATARRQRKLMREMEDLLAKEEKREPATQRLSDSLEDALLLLCAAPLATVKELSRFGRLPQSTLRDQMNRLATMGLADSVSHRLPDLGPRPQLRYSPTAAGIIAAGKAEHGTERFLSMYPVSRPVVPHPGGTPGRRGRGLSRRRPHRRRRPERPTRPGGPLPPRTLRRPSHPLRGPHPGHHPPGTHAAVPQPALPLQDRREPPLPPAAHGHCQNRPGAVAVSRYRPSEAPKPKPR